MGSGISIFRFRGIEVVIDGTWFIIFFLVVVGLGGYWFPEEYPGLGVVGRWSLATLVALAVFASVLLHEFSHSLVAQGMGMEINRIVLFVFGGVAQIKGEPPDARSELLIAAAGPACSIVLGGAFMTASVLVGDLAGPSVQGALWYLGYVNLVLVVFNMVPGFPLDGGRILRAVLWGRWGDLRRATGVVSTIGKGFAYVLIGLGFLGLLAGVLVQGLFFIFIGMFLHQAAASGYQQVALREGLSGTAVSDLMTPDPVTVPGHLTLEDLVDEYFFHHRFAAFPVVREEELVGVITINHVKEHPREEWASTSVQAAMTSLEGVPTLAPSDDAYEAMMRMMDSDIGRMPVVAGGRVVGIVSRSDIVGFVRTRTQLGELGA